MKQVIVLTIESSCSNIRSFQRWYLSGSLHDKWGHTQVCTEDELSSKSSVALVVLVAYVAQVT
jgi:hypothetical protein